MYRIILFLMLAPGIALAQAAGVSGDAAAGVTDLPMWLQLLGGILSLIVSSGALATVVSSNSMLGKIIDVIALNIGKAANDPNAQGK